jgi:hypothetical protein
MDPLPVTASTRRPQLQGFTDPRLLSSKPLFNFHQPQLAGQASNWLKNASDSVFLDTQHKEKSRRHDEPPNETRNITIIMDLLLDEISQLHDCMKVRCFSYVLGGKVNLLWSWVPSTWVMLMSVFPLSLCTDRSGIGERVEAFCNTGFSFRPAGRSPGFLFWKWAYFIMPCMRVLFSIPSQKVGPTVGQHYTDHLMVFLYPNHITTS